MRGEFFIVLSTFLSAAALIMLIFVHVGQINTSTVPRGVFMTKVNVSQYGEALTNALLDPITGLYTSNASLPLQEQAGLRQFYGFGLYAHCGYINDTAGICSNHTFGHQFRPYDYLTEDMAANFSLITSAIILPGTTFRDSNYLGQATKAGFWMIFLGTITTAFAFLTGVSKRSYTFFLSAIFSVISSLLILIGAAIWTVMIKKSEGVNEIFVGSDSNPISIGFEVSPGIGLYLVWASFAASIVSIIPYMITCCTFRG